MGRRTSRKNTLRKNTLRKNTLRKNTLRKNTLRKNTLRKNKRRVNRKNTRRVRNRNNVKKNNSKKVIYKKYKIGGSDEQQDAVEEYFGLIRARDRDPTLDEYVDFLDRRIANLGDDKISSIMSMINAFMDRDKLRLEDQIDRVKNFEAVEYSLNELYEELKYKYNRHVETLERNYEGRILHPVIQEFKGFLNELKTLISDEDYRRSLELPDPSIRRLEEIIRLVKKGDLVYQDYEDFHKELNYKYDKMEERNRGNSSVMGWIRNHRGLVWGINNEFMEENERGTGAPASSQPSAMPDTPDDTQEITRESQAMVPAPSTPPPEVKKSATPSPALRKVVEPPSVLTTTADADDPDEVPDTQQDEQDDIERMEKAKRLIKSIRRRALDPEPQPEIAFHPGHHPFNYKNFTVVGPALVDDETGKVKMEEFYGEKYYDQNLFIHDPQEVRGYGNAPVNQNGYSFVAIIPQGFEGGFGVPTGKGTGGAFVGFVYATASDDDKTIIVEFANGNRVEVDLTLLGKYSTGEMLNIKCVRLKEGVTSPVSPLKEAPPAKPRPSGAGRRPGRRVRGQ